MPKDIILLTANNIVLLDRIIDVLTNGNSQLSSVLELVSIPLHKMFQLELNKRRIESEKDIPEVFSWGKVLIFAIIVVRKELFEQV